MDNNYVEIKIPRGNNTSEQQDTDLPLLEVDLETGEQTELRQPVKEQSFIEQPQEEDQTPVNEKQEKPQTSEERKPNKRQSRYQARVRQLNERAKTAEEMLEQERREKYELQKQLNQLSKTSKGGEKKNLETLVASLTGQKKKAMQEGDTDLVVEIDDQIMEAKTALKVLELQLAEAEAQPEPEYKPQPKQPEINELAQQWLEDHPEVFQDRAFGQAAATVNNSLVMEGYLDSDTEFYEELSRRLAKRFPKYFQEVGPSKQNSVQYSEEDSSTDVKPQPTSATSPTIKQTVSGASRTANVLPSNRSSSERKVTLTPMDLEHMERWGMPLERLAKRKEHIANNTRTDGYVPIIIPKK